jgi:hypothetical protein
VEFGRFIFTFVSLGGGFSGTTVIFVVSFNVLQVILIKNGRILNALLAFFWLK